METWPDPGETATAAEVALAVGAIDAEPAVRRQRGTVLQAWASAQASQPRPMIEDRSAPDGLARGDRRVAAKGSLGARALPGRLPGPLRLPARPLLASLVALLVTAGTVTAAAQPGAPLYTTRLAVERATLPTPGAADRLDADVAYADRRLSETAEAIDRHDEGAALAALDAFDDAVGRLAADASGDVRRLERPLRDHLRAIGSASGSSSAVIRQALEAAGRTVAEERGAGHPVAFPLARPAPELPHRVR